MKKSLLFTICYLIMLMIFNACQAKEIADCLHTGDCAEYENPPADGALGQTEIKADSLAYEAELNRKKSLE